MTRHVLLALAYALAALPLATGCVGDPEPAPAPAFVCTPLSAECTGEAPSYANVVASILENNCSQCHNHDNTDGNWPLDDVIDVGDWSAQIQLMLADCLMPPRDSDVIMTEADRETLNAWIVCGAPDN